MMSIWTLLEQCDAAKFTHGIFHFKSNVILLGLLVRVYSKAASWTIQYRYDGLGRRVAARNSLGQHLQFFYADLNYPTRITHVYNHSSSEITSFYYDLQVTLLNFFCFYVVFVLSKKLLYSQIGTFI